MFMSQTESAAWKDIIVMIITSHSCGIFNSLSFFFFQVPETISATHIYKKTRTILMNSFTNLYWAAAGMLSLVLESRGHSIE